MRISLIVFACVVPLVTAQVPFFSPTAIFDALFQLLESILAVFGISINTTVNTVIQGACDSVLAELQMEGLGCKCSGDVGDLEAKLDCDFQACLVGGQFFCGGGSFTTTIDVEDPGLENDFTTCLKMDAGLPVGTFDEVEVCYTATLLNGMFNECAASANAVGGILGGGSCVCSVCDNSISVSIDCSMLDIGIAPFAVSGPQVDFCALGNFLPAF